MYFQILWALFFLRDFIHYISVKNTFSSPIILSKTAVYLTLIIVGSLSSATFFVGFYSGKHAGFELALDATRSSLPKVPVKMGDAVTTEQTEKVVKDIYARLSAEQRKIVATPIPGKKEEALIISLIGETTAKIDESNGRIAWGNPKAGFYALVGSPRKREDAEGLARSLVRAGFEVAVQSQTIKEVTYFRVLVGPEEKESQANRLIEELKREPYIIGEPVLTKR